MKFCENCGKELSEYAVICVDCGTPVKTEEAPVAAKAEEPKKEISILAICGLAISAISLVATLASIVLTLFFSALVGMLVAGFAAIISIAGVVLSIIGFAKAKKEKGRFL